MRALAAKISHKNRTNEMSQACAKLSGGAPVEFGRLRQPFSRLFRPQSRSTTDCATYRDGHAPLELEA
jgi:hypothetical protein